MLRASPPSVQQQWDPGSGGHHVPGSGLSDRILRRQYDFPMSNSSEFRWLAVLIWLVLSWFMSPEFLPIFGSVVTLSFDPWNSKSVHCQLNWSIHVLPPNFNKFPNAFWTYCINEIDMDGKTDGWMDRHTHGKTTQKTKCLQPPEVVGGITKFKV